MLARARARDMIGHERQMERTRDAVYFLAFVMFQKGLVIAGGFRVANKRVTKTHFMFHNRSYLIRSNYANRHLRASLTRRPTLRAAAPGTTRETAHHCYLSRSEKLQPKPHGS